MAAEPARRRVLRLIGLSGLAVVLPRRATEPAPTTRWHGVALGAPARIELSGVEPSRARGLIAACLEEVSRLEAIFSLYEPDSALSHLNRDGVLRRPPAELVEVLGLARRLAALSEGAFDPTVQPLWYAVARGADREERRAARRLVNWQKLEASPEAVALHRPGMAITLDGIAQGYLTDRVAELLRSHGVGRVLVDLGELRALGSRPDGAPWRIGHFEPTPIALAEGALSTSRAVVDGRPRILDPRTGEPPPSRAVTVVAPEAAVADGLSTALAAADAAAADRLLAAFPGARRIAGARERRPLPPASAPRSATRASGRMHGAVVPVSRRL